MLRNESQKTFRTVLFVLLSLFSLLIPEYALVNTTGPSVDDCTKKAIKLVDSQTERPIEGAFITSGEEVERTDANGIGYIKIADGQATVKVAVRASGYSRSEVVIVIPRENDLEPFSPKALYLSLREKVVGKDEESVPVPLEVKLLPFTPKALYLSFYGIGDRTLRQSALKLIRETELNSLVIDAKGDKGTIPYKSSIPLATEVGAQKIITVRDMGGLIKSFREDGIYTIARIVVFKDNLLAQKRPELAVKTQKGEIWRDREGLAWVDPFKKEAWDYTINVAVEAAQLGFDEIQFDYVRFPDASAPQFSMANTRENRVQAVSGFLTEARKRLQPYNVFLSADIFGYVCWNLNDTCIGQTIEDIPPIVDYVAPMLYPSGFQFGIPGHRIPVKNPYEIVYLTLKRAQERTKLPSVRFRPWLQAFKDYAFDGRPFGDKQIRDQISAADKFGSHGWMLWNPRNSYSTNGLKGEGSTKVAFREPTN